MVTGSSKGQQSLCLMRCVLKQSEDPPDERRLLTMFMFPWQCRARSWASCRQQGCRECIGIFRLEIVAQLVHKVHSRSYRSGQKTQYMTGLNIKQLMRYFYLVLSILILISRSLSFSFFMLTLPSFTFYVSRFLMQCFHYEAEILRVK